MHLLASDIIIRLYITFDILPLPSSQIAAANWVDEVCSKQLLLP